MYTFPCTGGFSAVSYYLRVVKTDGSVDAPQITIYVEPVAEAPAIARFTVNPGGTIVLGQCVLAEWDVQGHVNRVKITRDAVSWDGAPFRGNFPDCLERPAAITYILEAFGPGGVSQAVQQLTVAALPVAPPVPPPIPAPEPPKINRFTLSAGGQDDVQEIFLGNCVTISWQYSGRDLAHALLLRNENTVVQDPPQSGSKENCPPAPGEHVYRLGVDSEFGESASAQRTLPVVGPSPR